MDLIQIRDDHNVPLARTGSTRREVDVMVGPLAPLDRFTVVVRRTTTAKEAGSRCLRVALRALGAAPNRSVAIEDSWAAWPRLELPACVVGTRAHLEGEFSQQDLRRRSRRTRIDRIPACSAVEAALTE
jgi:hypothetical protein